MPSDLERLVLSLVRSRHAERMLPLLHAVLLAQLLAGGRHDGPPHAAQRAPRSMRATRHRMPRRDSLSGRRPRG